MDRIDVVMPKDYEILMEDLLTLTENGCSWFFIEDKAMSYLRKVADDEETISNLIQIQFGNIRILAGPHTTVWWRIYLIKGDISFKEAFNPKSVIFMWG